MGQPVKVVVANSMASFVSFDGLTSGVYFVALTSEDVTTSTLRVVKR
ncbi:MAG: hypothetical protein JKY53_07340 [Flavobacteriales bacterium]|nr:hypothetical protein [Flavobacteriales bacterium]